jgi:4-hydroxy-tetrahydrodipicolinate synthase
MVTPLEDRDRLDVEGLERLIEHILGGGVHGLFILGTTGEAPSLSHRLRHELIERTCRQVAGRAAVLVGVTDTAFVESVNMARKAADCGAAAVVAAPPFYFPAGQPELVEYLEHLTAALPLPLFLYNMPTHTKLVFEPETLRAAAGMPGIVGLKDSSGDLDYFRKVLEVLNDRPDFTLLIGPEVILVECLRLGAHGGVSGSANLLPKLYVDLYNAAAARDQEAIQPLHERVVFINEKIYRVGRHPSSYLKGLKCALNLTGICSDFMAEPFHRFRGPERETIRRYLEEMGLRTQ